MLYLHLFYFKLHKDLLILLLIISKGDLNKKFLTRDLSDLIFTIWFSRPIH